MVKPSNPKLYIGRFKTEINQPVDIILSSDSKEEYNNKLPQKDKGSPFELKDDECVISYTLNGKIEYFKVSNIRKEVAVNYPGVQPEQD